MSRLYIAHCAPRISLELKTRLRRAAVEPLGAVCGLRDTGAPHGVALGRNWTERNRKQRLGGSRGLAAQYMASGGGGGVGLTMTCRACAARIPSRTEFSNSTTRTMIPQLASASAIQVP